MKNIFSVLFLTAVSFLMLLNSCTNETDGINPGGSGTERDANMWIYSKLSEWYLWDSDVKAKTPNYSLSYDNFFVSMLSVNKENPKRENQVYSYINRYASSRSERGALYERSHGIDMQLMLYSSSPSSPTASDPVMAVVTFIREGSPAALAGIKRGDRIFNVNGVEMTYGNYTQFIPLLYSDRYSGANPQTVLVKYYRGQSTVESSSVSLTPTSIESDPIPICKILDDGKTGYLYYASFETGGDNHDYDDKLKRSMRSLAGVSNLVIDLRYNGGGYVSCCQLLASMITSQGKEGADFLKRTYNTNKGANTDKILTVSQMKSSSFGTGEEGIHLGLDKVYIIATENSASASEALIHGLRGVGVEVIHIGETTYGKNVGMSGFKSRSEGKDFGSYDYEMWPVTFTISNAAGNSYSSSGINPADYGGYLYEELRGELKDLGDPQEVYLKAALQHINNESFPMSRRANVTDNFAVLRGLDQPRMLKYIEN